MSCFCARPATYSPRTLPKKARFWAFACHFFSFFGRPGGAVEGRFRDPRPIPPENRATRDLFPPTTPPTRDLFPPTENDPRPIPPATRDLFPPKKRPTRDLFPPSPSKYPQCCPQGSASYTGLYRVIHRPLWHDLSLAAGLALAAVGCPLLGGEGRRRVEGVDDVL